MTKEALFNLFKSKKIPQGSGKDTDYTLCLGQIYRQGQLSTDSVREMEGWAREYVGHPGFSLTGVSTQNDTPTCAKCGCKGNHSCGHEPVDQDLLCTLDGTLVCPCCVKREMP